MLLRDLREQLQAAGSVPLVELAQRNGLPLEQLLTLLEPWRKRGRVLLVEAPGSCSSRRCGSCSSPCTEQRLVQWQASLPA
ncbi:FeoC like transcriptional regulator [Pseudomonas pohangensis]|jgi:hypothetical protein|uniref:FeoC like transcriptional regulator n=1 Tax=Pseudomonas pohangensis TaxID=364197 RepID=A0A1H2HVV8_9PSED|nr:FeoC-like transcriptional regulator [Pseudomonas pohangensis]SDU36033.1 FeoC like transcriptional regulator [Pseudomonas pohangensis]